MMPRLDPTPEIGRPDPLDSTLVYTPTAGAVARMDLLLRSRAALGLAPAAAPAFVFVSLGWLLGPSALGVLSPRVILQLDLPVSVALATLGVFVGLGLDIRQRTDRSLLGVATVEAALTIAAVGAATIGLLRWWEIDAGVSAVALAAVLGIAASASSSGAADATANPLLRAAGRIADLDDVLPIVVGGLVIPWIVEPHWASALQAFGWSVLLGGMLAAAGWLLFTSTSSREEQAVFLLGLVLLLGGTASYLGLSPLLVGLVAGVIWTYTPGHADLIAREYLDSVQHPLVLLLLLTAGATVAVVAPLVWLVIPFVAMRMMAKLAGGRLAARLAPRSVPAHVGVFLLPPGVIGIAFVLNLHQVMPGPRGAAIVGIAALGTVASELLALLIWPARQQRF